MTVSSSSSSSSWRRRRWRRSCDNIVVRRRPKNGYRIFLTVCFFVILYSNYWKSIVQTSDKIIFDNSIDSDSDSPTVKVKESEELPSQQKKNDKTTYHQQERNTVNFYMLDTPDVATILYLQQRVDGGKNNKNRTVEALTVASEYYRNNINEESAEMWLHRGFKQLKANRTYNSTEADVYIVGGYFHLYSSGKIMMHPNKPSRKRKKRKNKNNIDDDDDDDGDNRTESSSSVSTSWDVVVSTLYRNIIIDSTKPHLILIPTWNPSVSRRIGLHSLVRTLRLSGISDSNIWSVGFERNLHWQPIPHVSHIIPIPYVVTSNTRTRQQQLQPQKPKQIPSLLPSTDSSTTNTTRKKNFVFYVGDYRRNAGKWAGCFRSNLTQSLLRRNDNNDSSIDNNNNNYNNIDVRLVHKKDRLNQTLYNMRMRTSEYCLILCGDTPSSRSLSSAIVEGCIPIQVGSRLRGLCNPPCHEGFGWTISGPKYPHLPYGEIIPYDFFPEIDEKALLLMNNNKNDGGDDTSSTDDVDGDVIGSSKPSDLETLFGIYDDNKKKHLRSIMEKVHSGFIYGYGDPVSSEEFGDAASYIWESFVVALKNEREQ
jgi:hypothetical protein